MGEFKQISRETIRTEGFPKSALDLSEEVMLSLSEEQKQIISDFTDLWDKEKELIEQIKTCKSNLTTVDCDDEVSLRVLTLKPRSELKEIQTKMKVLLDKALDSGIGSLKIIQKNCDIFNVRP